VAPGVRGTPAKLDAAEDALAENASHARTQKIFTTLERRFLDARATYDVTTIHWKQIFLIALRQDAG
jgi:hypothetical protein